MIIKKLIILDPSNEEANNFEFSDKANIITAKGNKKGKTSLYKSLYYSLGLNIKNFPNGWNYRDMLFKVYYEHKNLSGYIIRYKDKFYTSDMDNSLNDKEYSEWLCELLGITLKLVHKTTEESASLRASTYLFPFYIDQDKSWGGDLYKTHLKDISHYKNMPSRPIEYLLGCYSDDLNDLDQQRVDLMSKQKLLLNQSNALEALKESLIKKQTLELNFDEKAVEKEIKTYLNLAKKLSDEVCKYKLKVYKKRISLDSLMIESQEMDKLSKNNKSGFKDVDHCKCPICESELTIEQSIKRIKIKHTEFNINMHKRDIDTKISELEKEIQDNKNIQLKIDVEYQELLSIANVKNQELTLNQYIEEKANNYSNYNYYKALEELKSNINNIEKNIHEIDSKIKEIKNNLQEQKTQLEAKFDFLKIAFKKALPNSTINEKTFLHFYAIKGSGAEVIHTIFSVYLIYFLLLLEFSKIEFPFGIDTIIKDDIDKQGIADMYKTLENYLITKDCQSFVIMLEDRLNSIPYKNYKHIDLSKNERLLSNKKYIDLQSEFHCILGENK